MANQHSEGQLSASFHPIVGIDLGTTNSAIAIIRQGRPEIIPAPSGDRIIPSVVHIDLNGKVVVGKDARDALVAMPDRTVAAIKRKMGSAETISMAGQALLPEEISAFILKELKGYADALLGEGTKEAVITVPAYFTDNQRRATQRAGELAGFIVERIINEPTAAALAFGLGNLEEDRHIVVYDLGGGTFDVSICEMMSGIIEVKASAGNRNLGGEDFDWHLVDLFAERVMEEHGVDPRQDLRARALLKEEAERVKQRLSFETTVAVSLPLVTVKENTPIGLAMDVTRDVFESMIEDLLQETVQSVKQVLADAGCSAGDMDEVLLVGGSTRIPRVRALMKDLFGKEPLSGIHPDEAVALGAAVQAGLKSGALSDTGLVVTDVARFSMGIAVLKQAANGIPRPGGFSTIISRNATIPVSRKERYMTAEPGQTAVSIEIYQGEAQWVKHNHPLGEFMLRGIPENFDSPEAIEVEFRYNINGILEVSATVESTGKSMQVIVQDALRRESGEAFAESLARVNSLTDNQTTDDDEDWDDDPFDNELNGTEDDFDFDVVELDAAKEHDADEGHSAAGWDGLCAKAKRLQTRASKLRVKLSASRQMKVDEAIRLLESAIATHDENRLRDAMDVATDTLIELEF